MDQSKTGRPAQPSKPASNLTNYAGVTTIPQANIPPASTVNTSVIEAVQPEVTQKMLQQSRHPVPIGDPVSATPQTVGVPQQVHLAHQAELYPLDYTPTRDESYEPIFSNSPPVDMIQPTDISAPLPPQQPNTPPIANPQPQQPAPPVASPSAGQQTAPISQAPVANQTPPFTPPAPAVPLTPVPASSRFTQKNT